MTYYVKKEGNVCSYFLNEFGQSIPFSRYEETPEIYSLVQTCSYPEMQAVERSGTKVVYIERPKKPEQVGPDSTRLDAAQLRSHMEAMGIPQEEIRRMTEGKQTQSRAIPTADGERLNSNVVKQDLEEIEIMDKLKQEFRILMAKYSANPSSEAIKAEVQAVANFLLSCYPNLEEELVALKEQATKPRFKL